MPADVPLDHDEIYWVGSTYYYDLAFVRHDWTHPAWRLQPARENPPVAKYVLGLGMATAGYHVTNIDSLSYFYLFWLQWEKDPTARVTGLDGEKRAKVVDAATPGFREWVLAHNRAPLTRPVVYAARTTSLICALTASLLLLVFGLKTDRPVTGLIASQLLLIHPAVQAAASHGMADAIALMFSIAAALVLFHWSRRMRDAQRRSSAEFLPATVSAGVLLALACGAKMNSLVVAILAAVVAIAITLKKWHQRDRKGALDTAIHFLGMCLVALLVFVVINPAILQDFAGGLSATVMEHRRTETLQVDLAHPRLTALLPKFDAVISLGFFGWVAFLVMISGVSFIAIRKWNDASIRFAVCWWLVAFSCVAAWIPFQWTRYIIPVLPPSVWLVGYSLSVAVQWLFKRFRPTLGEGAVQSEPGLQ